jgi:hypothetical protein
VLITASAIVEFIKASTTTMLPVAGLKWAPVFHRVVAGGVSIAGDHLFTLTVSGVAINSVTVMTKTVIQLDNPFPSTGCRHTDAEKCDSERRAWMPAGYCDFRDSHAIT